MPRLQQAFHHLRARRGAPLYVLKKDGRREEFSRPKLLSGLVMASKKTRLAPANLELMVAEIENALRSQNISEIRAGRSAPW